MTQTSFKGIASNYGQVSRISPMVFDPTGASRTHREMLVQDIAKKALLNILRLLQGDDIQSVQCQIRMQMPMSPTHISS
jgi:hypothetical protein